MKKKFVKSLLMVAIAVAPMSFLTSCTDHEDDRIKELQILLMDPNSTFLKDAIAAQTADLERRITELEDAQKACAANCSTLRADLSKYLTIAKAEQTYLTIAGAQALYVQKGDVYTKAEIDAMLANLPSANTFTKEEIINIINQVLNESVVNNYITRNEINTIKQEIINNLLNTVYTKTEVENLLKNYITNEYLTQNFYTKQEVVNLINQVINNYYTKNEIDNIVNDLLQRIAEAGPDTYTKEEIDAMLGNLVNRDLLDQLLSNYVTKQDLENALSDKISRDDLNQILTHYYTKEDIVYLLSQFLTDNEINLLIREYLKSYFTAKEVLELLQKTLVDGGYITREEVEQMLDNYYPKSELFTREEVKAMFLNYYDKDYIDNLIADYLKKSELADAVKNLIDETATDVKDALVKLINLQINTSTFNYGDDKITIQEAVNILYEINGKVSEALATANAAKQLAEANKDAITNLQNEDTKLWEAINNIRDSLNNNYYGFALNSDLLNVKNTADNALALAQAHEDLIKSLQERSDSIVKALDSLSQFNHNAIGQGGNCTCDFADIIRRIDSLADATKDLPEIRQNVAEAQQNIQRLEELINTAKDSLAKVTDSLGGVTQLLESNLATLEDAYKRADQALQDQIDDLKDQVDTNTQNIATLNDKVTQILQTMATKEWVLEQLSKQVTGIQLQGVYSPVLGEGALPLGMELNVLAAYHGYATNYTFPNTDDVVFTDSNGDLDMLEESGFDGSSDVITGSGELYYGKDEGKNAYAGKVYMTINPSTVDFSGLTLGVENSQGFQPGIELNNVKKSDKVLTWGYTRANDGFYEADAEVAPENFNKIKASINLGEIKDLAVDLKNFRTQGFNVTKIISTIYESVGDMLPRYAISAKYTDDNGTHKVVSKYELAATTVKPLPFHHAALESYAQDGLPGLERIEKFIGNLRGRIQSMLVKVTNKGIDQVDFLNDIEIYALDSPDGDRDLLMKLSNINVLKVEVQDAIEFEFSIWDPDMNEGRGGWRTVVANSVGTGETKSYTLTVDISDLIEELYNDVADPIQKALDGIKDLIATFNSVDDKIDYYADKAENAIIKYLEKFNDRLARYLDPNRYLATTMMVNVGNAYTRMSPSIGSPSKASETSVKFLPTTFNAEIISPAYKKFVAITNVWKADDPTKSAKTGDSECLSALKAANAQDEMMTILEGNKIVVHFTGQTGYKYEVLYSALDFEGNVSNKKYYIQF